ncbi:alpha/beta fold hydrolase [Amycolatopsis sulphurea]|uniref:alpha/beta fold hydrolase n=1 Tax=Amycolatopsis sulphurea TaxID=76022 RepID=UPI000BF3FA1A|nr:alpha/beta hydrolase [Amycolatopsis sulphurea]
MDPLGNFRLADGREVAWGEFGDPTSPVVFWLHGLGNCRVSGKGMHALASDAGVRIIAPDRPGIGLSSPQPGRRILDYPADLTALADHFGLEQYQVLGISGGGPFALACAAQGDTRHFAPS